MSKVLALGWPTVVLRLAAALLTPASVEVQTGEIRGVVMVGDSAIGDAK